MGKCDLKWIYFHTNFMSEEEYYDVLDRLKCLGYHNKNKLEYRYSKYNIAVNIHDGLIATCMDLGYAAKSAAFVKGDLYTLFNTITYHFGYFDVKEYMNLKTKMDNKHKKLNLADLLNMKCGDIFYYNYSHLKSSVKYIFSHLDLSSDYQHIVAISDYGGIFYSSNLSIMDCGVIPYNYDMKYETSVIDKNGFNKTNFLTKERMY